MSVRIADNLMKDLPFLEIPIEALIDAVYEPDEKDTIDLNALETERLPNAPALGKNMFLYIILKKIPSEDFHLLLVCSQNEGQEVLVNAAFKVTEDISEKIDSKSPIDVLRDITDRFGLPMYVDGEEHTFLAKMEILGKKGENIHILEADVPAGHHAMFSSAVKIVNGGKKAIFALKFVIDLSKYQEWLFVNKLSRFRKRATPKKTERVKAKYTCGKCNISISRTDEKCPNGHDPKEVGIKIKLPSGETATLIRKGNIVNYIPNTNDELKHKIIKNLKGPEGTFVFTGKFDTLWDELNKKGILLQVTSGKNIFLLNKSKNFIISFTMASLETGTRLVTVDGSQLVGKTTLQFFLTWSREKIGLAIGSVEKDGVLLFGRPAKTDLVLFVEEDGTVVAGKRGDWIG